MGGRQCTVCTSDFRKEVDAALLSGSPSINRLCVDFQLTRQSILRHRSAHLIPADAAAAAVAEAAAEDAATAATGTRRPGADGGEENISVVDEIKRLGRIAQSIMRRAYNSGDLRNANVYLETARRCLETQAKCLGELSGDGGTVINITQNVQFKTVTLNLMRALAPYPEAKAAVLAALGDEFESAEPRKLIDGPGGEGPDG